MDKLEAQAVHGMSQMWASYERLSEQNPEVMAVAETILRICCKTGDASAFDALSADEKVGILGLARLASAELTLRGFRKRQQEVESEPLEPRSDGAS